MNPPQIEQVDVEASVIFTKWSLGQRISLDSFFLIQRSYEIVTRPAIRRQSVFGVVFENPNATVLRTRLTNTQFNVLDAESIKNCSSSIERLLVLEDQPTIADEILLFDGFAHMNRHEAGQLGSLLSDFRLEDIGGNGLYEERESVYIHPEKRRSLDIDRLLDDHVGGVVGDFLAVLPFGNSGDGLGQSAVTASLIVRLRAR